MITKDKEIEKDRYNKFSLKKTENLDLLGASNYSMYLQPPYIRFEEIIINLSNNNNKIKQLDLCCGDGIHSFIGAKYGADVIAVDYAENSILLAKKRAKEVGIKVEFFSSDVENLPFPDETFDLITCIGSLSYVEPDIFLYEVKRLLKPNGRFVVVDSFNHNFIYKLNRYIHFFLGNRSKSTLKRMPDEKYLKIVKSYFRHFEVEYFGIFVFLAPLLLLLFTPAKVDKILKRLDIIFWRLRRYSFKILFIAVK